MLIASIIIVIFISLRKYSKHSNKLHQRKIKTSLIKWMKMKENWFSTISWKCYHQSILEQWITKICFYKLQCLCNECSYAFKSFKQKWVVIKCNGKGMKQESMVCSLFRNIILYVGILICVKFLWITLEDTFCSQ